MAEVNYMEAFIKNVEKILFEKRISRTDLAKLLGVTTQSISRYLSGNHAPGLETIVRLAGVLDVRPYDLLNPYAQKESTPAAHSMSPTEAALLGAIRQSGGDQMAKVLLDSLLAKQKFDAQKAELAKKKA